MVIKKACLVLFMLCPFVRGGGALVGGSEAALFFCGSGACEYTPAGWMIQGRGKKSKEEKSDLFHVCVF